VVVAVAAAVLPAQPEVVVVAAAVLPARPLEALFGRIDTARRS
jgi:hypothetical protein